MAHHRTCSPSCLALRAALNEELAVEIARLRKATRAAGLSLGDHACLALGRLTARPVLTADRSWAALDVGVRIMLVR